MHGINSELLTPAKDAVLPGSAFPQFGGKLAKSSDHHLINRERKVVEPLPNVGTGIWFRLLDVVGAAGLIIVLAPVMLLVALLIVVSDPGPVLFRHRRVGLNGRSFECLKFRTMRVDAEAQLQKLLSQNADLKREWELGQKLSVDPRVTRFGNLLRISSLDELPQLFNVLFGEMSLVGPRPIVTAELARYGRYVSYYLSVKPGLSGLWQVSGRSATTFRRRVAADVLYVRKKSLALDIRILLATIPAVMAAKGAC